MKFLGIDLNCTMTTFVNKLKGKGFVQDMNTSHDNTVVMKGMFAGEKVKVEIKGAAKTHLICSVYVCFNLSTRYTYEALKNQLKDKYGEEYQEFYKDYNKETEIKLEAKMFEYVFKNIKATYCPDFLTDADKKFKSDFEKYVRFNMSKSLFADQESFEKFLNKPNAKVLEKDPMFVIGSQIYDKYVEVYRMIPQEINDQITRGNRDFVDGILQINQGKKQKIKKNY